MKDCATTLVSIRTSLSSWVIVISEVTVLESDKDTENAKVWERGREGETHSVCTKTIYLKIAGYTTNIFPPLWSDLKNITNYIGIEQPIWM